MGAGRELGQGSEVEDEHLGVGDVGYKPLGASAAGGTSGPSLLVVEWEVSPAAAIRSAFGTWGSDQPERWRIACGSFVVTRCAPPWRARCGYPPDASARAGATRRAGTSLAEPWPSFHSTKGPWRWVLPGTTV
jgi:hypothetical protein